MMDGRLHVYKREGSRYWQCSAFLVRTGTGASQQRPTVSPKRRTSRRIGTSVFRGKLKAGDPQARTNVRAGRRPIPTEYENHRRRAQRLRRRTWRRLHIHSVPFFGNIGLSGSPGPIQEFRIKRKNEVVKGKETSPARNTLHQEIVVLRQTLKTAVRHGWLDRLPDLSEPYRAPAKSRTARGSRRKSTRSSTKPRESVRPEPEEFHKWDYQNSFTTTSSSWPIPACGPMKRAASNFAT